MNAFLGSYECRVGWASNEDPMMIFRNLIAKPRREKVKKDGELPLIQPNQIGNDIVNIEAMRYQLRTQVGFISFNMLFLLVKIHFFIETFFGYFICSFQFDRNVVTHFHNQEVIFDDIFKHLAIDSENGVNHPIVLTECVANPNYCRQRKRFFLDFNQFKALVFHQYFNNFHVYFSHVGAALRVL